MGFQKKKMYLFELSDGRTIKEQAQSIYIILYT